MPSGSLFGVFETCLHNGNAGVKNQVVCMSVRFRVRKTTWGRSQLKMQGSTLYAANLRSSGTAIT